MTWLPRRVSSIMPCGLPSPPRPLAVVLIGVTPLKVPLHSPVNFAVQRMLPAVDLKYSSCTPFESWVFTSNQTVAIASSSIEYCPPGIFTLAVAVPTQPVAWTSQPQSGVAFQPLGPTVLAQRVPCPMKSLWVPGGGSTLNGLP